MSCNVFNTEYTAEYTNKKHDKVPIHVPHDCVAKATEETEQDDHRTETARNLDKLKNDPLIEKLLFQRMRTVYQVDYNYNRELTKSGDCLDGDSELLKYSTKLYSNSHEESVPGLPITAKRVFGFASPKQLHSCLTTYQNTFGRTGARIIIKNANLIATRKRRRGYQTT